MDALRACPYSFTPRRDKSHTQIGRAHLELQAPLAPDGVFNVGSVAKQITAYLAVHSARSGLLDLRASVADILPRLQIPGITVTDLIRHDSGIRDAESLLSLAGFRDLDHYTSEDLLALAYRQTTRAVPAGQFLYSNTNYLLLAKILETIHGTNIQQLADEIVFTPLHYGHEHGFSATIYLTRAGLRVICLSNNAAIHADHVAARLLHHLTHEGTIPALPAWLRQLPTINVVASRHNLTTRTAGEIPHADQHTWLGTFACSEVPSVLRLSRHGSTLYLWRRGTADRLTPTADLEQHIYAGPGYKVTITLTSNSSHVDEFTFDLDRAPALRYKNVYAAVNK